MYSFTVVEDYDAGSVIVIISRRAILDYTSINLVALSIPF